MQTLLLLDFIFLGLCAPFLLYVIYGSSYELWTSLGPFLFLLVAVVMGVAALFIHSLSMRARKIMFRVILFAVHCYLFFYLYVFWALWRISS